MAFSSPLGEAYSFIESPECLGQVSEILGSVQRWDEIKEGLDFALSRDPRVGIPISGSTLYAIALLTSPAMTVYYTVDTNLRTVTVVEVRHVS